MRNMTKNTAMAIITAMMTFLTNPNMSGKAMSGNASPSPAIASPQLLPAVGAVSFGSKFGSN